MGVRHAAGGFLTAAAVLLGAPAADAGTVVTGCAGLQSAIDTASSHAGHGEGEVIVLSGMCNAAALKSKTGVAVPGESNITIEGEAGTTSGLDGAGVESQLMHTVSSEAAGTIAIRDLTFQHANVAAAPAPRCSSRRPTRRSRATASWKTPCMPATAGPSSCSSSNREKRRPARHPPRHRACT